MQFVIDPRSQLFAIAIAIAIDLTPVPTPLLYDIPSAEHDVHASLQDIIRIQIIVDVQRGWTVDGRMESGDRHQSHHAHASVTRHTRLTRALKLHESNQSLAHYPSRLTPLLIVLK